MADYTVSVNILATDQITPLLQSMNANLQTLADKTAATGQSAQASKTMWDNYKDTIHGVEVGLGTVNMAMDILGQGLEMVDLGENVHAVSAAFQALQGDAATAANTLQVVRDATSGVISDMDIESAVNRMQSMGLADTASEFGELIGMAQQLGSVMSPGATAAQNIDNFTLLLANQSVRRLDSFGISADAVRQRIEELKNEGYSAQEAFNMATLEQGRIALANLGDAATVGATNVDRLSTSWQNFTNRFAEQTATVVNEAAGTVEMISTLIQASIENNVGLFDAYLNYLDSVHDDPLTSSQGQIGAGVNTNTSGSYIGSQPDADYAMMSYISGIQNLDMDGLIADANAFAEGMMTGEVAIIAAKDATKDLTGAFQEGSVAAYDMQAAVEAMKTDTEAMKDGSAEASNSWSNMTGSISANADEAARLAQETALAAANASSLSQIFGQTSGGLGGQVAGDVEAAMRAAGATDAQIAAYNQSAGLATGTQTQSSVAYEQNVVPQIAMIAVQYGADAAAQATMNVQTGLATGSALGMTDQQMANSMGGMTGYTMQQSSAMGFQGLGTDTQGQTLGGAVEGFDAEAYVTSMATAADSTASMAESTASAEHSMQNMKTSGQQLATDMTRISTTMRSLPQAHTLTVTVRPNTTAMPAWFRDWVNQVVGERPSDQHPGQGGT